MLKHPETISYEQVKQTITSIPNQIDQGLAALAYATGSRVSELNKITKEDIHKEETGQYYFIYCPVLKKNRKPREPKRATPEELEDYKKKLAKWKPKHFERKAIVRADETWLLTPILNRANSLTEKQVLFDFNRMYIYRHLVKATNWNPHGFRKLRATHLRRVFGFDAYQLQQFFDWKTIEPSSYYVKLDPKEIMY